MRELVTRHPCPCSVEDFWGLRDDPAWDQYNAELDSQIFTVISKEEVLDPTLSAKKVIRTHQLKAKVNPIPKAIRGMLGSDEFKVVVEAEWYKLRYAKEEAMTLSVRPPVFASKISIKGMQWAERVDGQNCNLCTQMTISCKIPAGVGSQVEKGTEKGMKAAYADQPRRVMAFLNERRASGREYPDPFRDAAARKAAAVDATALAAASEGRAPESHLAGDAPPPPSACSAAGSTAASTGAASAPLPFSSPLASSQVLTHAAEPPRPTPPTGRIGDDAAGGGDSGPSAAASLPPSLRADGSSGAIDAGLTYDVTTASGSSLLLLRQTIHQQRTALSSAEAEYEALVRAEERRLNQALQDATERLAAMGEDLAAERRRVAALEHEREAARAEAQRERTRALEVGQALAAAVSRLQDAGVHDAALAAAAAPFAPSNGHGHTLGAGASAMAPLGALAARRPQPPRRRRPRPRSHARRSRATRRRLRECRAPS